MSTLRCHKSSHKMQRRVRMEILTIFTCHPVLPCHCIFFFRFNFHEIWQGIYFEWNEYVTIAVNRNLRNCENSPKKKFFGAPTGFEPVASALALQCSPSWAMKTHTREAPIYWVHQPVKGMKIHCDGHILISFVFPQFTSFHSEYILKHKIHIILYCSSGHHKTCCKKRHHD